MALKPLNAIVQRFRSKTFSPACLFRFSESPAPYPIATQSPRGRVVRGFPYLVGGISKEKQKWLIIEGI
jgi:hypothetical protein